MGRFLVNFAGPPQVAPALLPALPNSPTSLFWGGANVTGYPGTRAIPSPKPGVHSVSPNPATQPSWVSPDVIYPSLYWNTPDVQWRHIPVRPQEMMPVPARNLFNMAGVAMRSRRTGGRYQVAQPGVTPVWPDLLGRLVPGSRVAAPPLPPRGGS